MTPRGLLALTDPDASDARVAGGKAATLARLAAAGLAVPDGVVVTAATADTDLDDAAADLASRFADSRLAVRSSGVAEDLKDASYAGQYETVLNVPAEPAAIASALRRVRSSATAAHVEAYRPGHDTAMAILVMPMLEPTAAGIAFTRDPVTGAREVVIEAVAGLADRLAAGEVSGERWVVSDTVRRLSDLAVLDRIRAEAVARLARQVEELEGCPQDVEWALVGDDVYLLQARPITALDDVEPIPIEEEPPPGPWEWDSTHNRSPMTPLMASIFPEGFIRASRRLVTEYGAPFKQISARSIGGYLYFQVVPPFGKASVKAPPPGLQRLMFRLVPSLRRREQTARRAIEESRPDELVREWREIVAPRITLTLARWAEQDLADISDIDLAERLRAAAELEQEVFGWNMVTDLAYLLPLADLHRFVTAELGGDMAATTRLVAGASPSAYQRQAKELAERLSEADRRAILAGADLDDLSDRNFVEAFRRHLADEGLRNIGYDLSAPTLGEDPRAELLRIATLRADRRTAQGTFLDEAAASLAPEAADRLRTLTARARAAFPIREEGEAVHAKTVGTLRLVALEAGRRMVRKGVATSPEDALLLTLDELTGWLRNGGDVSDLIRRRRGEQRWAELRDPEPFIGGQASIPDLAAFPPHVARFMEAVGLIMAHDSRPADLGSGADGVPASPGRHTGPVRVVRSLEDFGKVRPGDVLVAPLTTSPWEVLFPHVGALVTEAGGLLSHPAIVAREYGLPAVVGCEGATSRFRDGDVVTVDGGAGTVTLVSEVGDGVGGTPRDEGRET